MMIPPAYIFLILIPLFTSPLVYLVGRLVCKAIDSRRGCLAGQIAGLLGFGLAWAAFVLAWQDLGSGLHLTVILGTVALRPDGIGMLLAAVVLILGTLVTLYSGPYVAGEAHEEKYYASLLAMCGAMIGLGFAADLFNLWIWFELMAIASFFLVAFHREQAASLEAGFKYLVQSATGSVLVLLGVAVVFGVSGTLDLSRIAMQEPSGWLIVAGALFVIGFGIKAAMVPLHTWLPDAHSQAPSGISAMLSGVVIEAGLIAMLRSVLALNDAVNNWGMLFLIAGAINMLVGNVMALRQTHLKRLLAYSSLAHVGYILLGIGVALWAGPSLAGTSGAEGSLFHVVNHALMKGLAFLAVGALLYALHLSRGEHGPLIKDDLNGAASRYPLLAFALSLAVLGLGGLPPLAGFFSKWQIFLGGFQTQDLVVSGFMIFAAFNSVLSLGYYAPLVNRMYRHKPSAAVLEGGTVSWPMGLPVILLAVAILVIGVWPGVMTWLTAPAGQALLAALR